MGSANRLALAVAASIVATSGLTCASAKESEVQDRTIKGIDPKTLPFNKVIKVETPYTNSIVYDRATEGDMCFITCNNYNGVTSKWSNYYVDLQPFENFCMFLTGCSSQYPLPSREVRLKVGDKAWTLKMSDPEQNRYYLPLEARKAIGGSIGKIELEISGIKMPVYRIGMTNLPLIAEVVNKTDEKQELLGAQSGNKSKENLLLELQSLREKGLIAPAEYDKARVRIIEGS